LSISLELVSRVNRYVAPKSTSNQTNVYGLGQNDGLSEESM